MKQARSSYLSFAWVREHTQKKAQKSEALRATHSNGRAVLFLRIYALRPERFTNQRERSLARKRHLLMAGKHLINEAIIHRLLRRHEEVTISIGLDTL